MATLLNKEFKIGVVTVICGILLYFGIEYLKGINIFKPENYYFVKFENVTGLAVSSPVNINGFKVGLVRNMQYDYSHPGNVIVEITLDKQLQVPQGSKVIASSDLLGSTVINLELNNYVSTNHTVSDTLIGITDKGLMGKATDELIPQVEKLLPKIDSILTGINALVNDTKLTETLINVNTLTQDLTVSTAHLNRTLGNDVPVIMGNLKTITSNFSTLSQDLNEANIDQVILSAHQTIDHVKALTEKMNQQDNTLGLLLNSDQLYQNVNHLLNSTDSLMIDLKQNPKRYVHFSLF